jgi:hypothetical protein
MRGGLGPRFLIEAGFLIAVAVAAGLARLDAIWIIVVMAGAWLLMAAVEWGISHLRRRPAAEPMAAPTEPLEQRREPPAVRPLTPAPEPATVVAAPAHVPAPAPVPQPVAERSEPEPEPAPAPDVTPGPSPEPDPEPDAPAEPAPAETEPDRPRVAAVAPLPEPEPIPEPPVAEPAVAAEETHVLAFTPRSLGVPQRWNLWELERIAREQSGGDAIRDEERSFLLMYLRDFADADGVLPTSFDGVVREAFGDVLDAVRA